MKHASDIFKYFYCHRAHWSFNSDIGFYMGLLINLDRHLCNGRRELVSSLLSVVLCYLSVITSVSTSVIIHILSTLESFTSFS